MLNKKAFSLIELSIVILIIGIIVAGVTSSSRLIGVFRLSSARTITQSSPVHSIEGVYAWLEATGENSYDVKNLEDGDVITTWYDVNQQVREAERHNFTQSNSSYKPTYLKLGINNVPAVRFQNSASLQYSSVYFPNLTSDGALTIFMVANLKGSNDTQVALFAESTDRISMEFNTGVIRFDYKNGTTGKLLSSGNQTNKNVIIMLEKTLDTQNIYVNGTLIATQANSLTLGAYSALWILGDYSTPDIISATIDVGELIIYGKKLKAEEKNSIKNYLSQKWKIRVS